MYLSLYQVLLMLLGLVTVIVLVNTFNNLNESKKRKAKIKYVNKFNREYRNKRFLVIDSYVEKRNNVEHSYYITIRHHNYSEDVLVDNHFYRNVNLGDEVKVTKGKMYPDVIITKRNEKHSCGIVIKKEIDDGRNILHVIVDDVNYKFKVNENMFNNVKLNGEVCCLKTPKGIRMSNEYS